MESKDLFKGTAEYYSKYRLPYPKSLILWLARKARAKNKSARLLDIGCGTGQIVIPLSRYFGEVVAVDLDRGMLREGRRQAKLKKIRNIVWINAAAEGLSPKLGKFDLIAIGSAFHWMDRKKVLEFAHCILNPGGVLAIVGGNSWWEDKELWKKKIFEVIKKYLGPKRRAGKKGYFAAPEDSFEKLIKKAGFGKVEEKKFRANHIWTIQEIIGLMYSSSFASKNLLGERAANFEKDLANSLCKLNPRGRFAEKISYYALTAQKTK
ncbi:class I SAM-dependent methyltransferase [bacterium]|nr:MAG: class I SAM-dependent methyltransferase [bacterium]